MTISCSVPELLVLNDCNIDKAGEPDDIKEKCRSVKELDLAQNKLQSWDEVFKILTHLPKIEFVNLSLNRLIGPIEQPPMNYGGMNKIRSLVLNNTRLNWESVESLIRMMPVLEELHLSLNDYSSVLIDTLDDDVFIDDEMVMKDDDDQIYTSDVGQRTTNRSKSTTPQVLSVPNRNPIQSDQAIQRVPRTRKPMPMRESRSFISLGTQCRNGTKFVGWAEFFRIWSLWC